VEGDAVAATAANARSGGRDHFAVMSCPALLPSMSLLASCRSQSPPLSTVSPGAVRAHQEGARPLAKRRQIETYDATQV
jgi:hypothetical protein